MSVTADQIRAHEYATNGPSPVAEGVEFGSPVLVVYTNYRGETTLRKILPKRIWFGSTEWHPMGGWLLEAYDYDKQADRTFAMKDIRAWFAEGE
jgi:hypothetical protein